MKKKNINIIVLFALFFSLPVYANSKTLSPSEVKNVIPLLKKYDMFGLSISDQKGNPTSIVMAMRLAAEPETVIELLNDPDNYYHISSLFNENVVVARNESTVLVNWASRHKFLSITGKNRVTVYPPRQARILIEESSVGRGDFFIQLYKESPGYSIMVLSGFLNVNSSEWLIKYLVGGNPAMIEAMNFAIGYVIVKGVSDLAKRYEQGKKPVRRRLIGKAGGVPSVLSDDELNIIKPFLDRGQVIICDSHPGGRLKQATVIERVGASKDDFLKTAGNVNSYKEEISAISQVAVHGKQGETVDFSWRLGFSIFGISSRNELGPVDQGLLLSAKQGDLEGANWRWQVKEDTESAAIVAYHAYADVAKTSSVLRSTVRREPYLEHGLVLGSNIVMLRAMKRASEKK